MRLKSLLFALVFSVVLSHRAMADFDGLSNIDDDSAPNSEKSESSTPVDNSDGEGDDEDDRGAVMSDESGSTFGDEATTETSIVNVSVASPTTKGTATTEAETTTDIANQITHNTENTTEQPGRSIITQKQIGGKATEHKILSNGSFVGETTTEKSTEESPNAEGKAKDGYGSLMSNKSSNASGDETTTDPSTMDITVVSLTTKETATTEAELMTTNKQIRESTEKTTAEPENIITKEPIGGEKSPNVEARVFTTEVIVAVVLGAVCVVMLIAFLVYRLRKCDEGSYVVSDADYEDTLQGDMGKEAFV